LRRADPLAAEIEQDAIGGGMCPHAATNAVARLKDADGYSGSG
jgi:hypothetical protein